ncbi:MAG: YsnF/AvaK domain-containing protein [Candidatus Velthaea sp.]
MNQSGQDTRESNGRNAVAATFESREAAHAAAKRLHEEGFHGAWVGLTKPTHGGTSGERTAIESENWLQRMFGEGDESLHDALVRHGVREADFRSIGPVAPGSAILTIDGMNHPELAAQVISECGGDVITGGATGRGFTGEPLDDDDEFDYDYSTYGEYRGGESIDETRRIELREERLRINKDRVSSGEAIVGKEVVTQQQNIDVPVMHEELCIERRPASGSAFADAGEIGDGETIHVPLSEERVSVTKTPVVTEEIIVGQRQVEETQHISETTRKEQLNVNDPAMRAGRSTEDRL